jgi:hypothetical protein
VLGKIKNILHEILDFYCGEDSYLWGLWHRILWQLDTSFSAENNAFIFRVEVPTIPRSIATNEE